MQPDFTIKFWGVRGSVPTPGKATLAYGGNTSCVEVRCGEQVIILDAGTGIYPLSQELKAKDFDILLSHTHIDHIMGFPFLSQLYDEYCRIRVWAGHLLPQLMLESVMRRIMSPPVFPLKLEDLKAGVSFHDFHAGEDVLTPKFTRAGIRVRTLPLSHPDKATAYRIEYAGHSICYVTDVEHRTDKLDAALIRFINKTDFFIYDSMFDDAQFETYKGWGHSTWQHAMRLGEAAEVGTVVLFHHDPAAGDGTLDERKKALSKMKQPSCIAQEGLVLTPQTAHSRKSSGATGLRGG